MNSFKLALKARESKATSQTARERYSSCKSSKDINLFLLCLINSDDVGDMRDITLTVTMVNLAKYALIWQGQEGRAFSGLIPKGATYVLPCGVLISLLKVKCMHSS